VPQPKIHTAFQMLEERLKQLEDALNTNTKVFSDGIQMIEAQQEVLRRVAQGLFKGGVVSDGDGHIAWNHYLRGYLEELAASEAKEEAAPSPILLDSNGSDAPIIFGGG
jgi:hypothetical protein